MGRRVALDSEERLRAIRVLVVEAVVYGVLVTVYVISVLAFLMDPLAELYHRNRALYAAAALALIVGQGVFLEEVTSFLIDRLRVVRFD
jgi:hypothetical protein